MDRKKKLPSHANLSEEIKAWYDAYFTPILINTKSAKALGAHDIETGWKGEPKWSVPDWSTIVQHHSAAGTMQYAIFLRGFILRKSKWSAKLSVQSNDNATPIEHVFNPECHLTPAGLVLHFKINLTQYSFPTLKIIYHPNQGFDEQATSTLAIKMER